MDVARVAALALLSVLVGCAGRPEGVLTPLAAGSPVAGASDVDMLVATTRQSVADPAFLYSGERGARLSLTDIEVSIPPEAARKVGEVQWSRRLPPDPRREFATRHAAPIEIKDSRRWMADHLGAKRNVLVFVHGFNNRYEDSVYRFAQIVHDPGGDVTPVLFTWPSRASVFDYNYDRESTNYSRDGLELLLRAVSDDPNVGAVSVLAHSMSTWLAVEALRQMAIRDGRIAPKICNVMLASPETTSTCSGSSGRSSARGSRSSPSSSRPTIEPSGSRASSPETGSGSAPSIRPSSHTERSSRGRASTSSISRPMPATTT